MKLLLLLALFPMLFVFGCREGTGISPNVVSTKNKEFTLDTAIKDTVLRNVKLHSNKHFAGFETPAEIRFFADGAVVDSIIDRDFHMISWYSVSNDTIDLVAHVADFETEALLIRFLHGTPSVYYLRASHLGQKYFRLTTTDSLSDYVEVPPVYYDLNLSVVPDSIQKPKVFGSIDMESRPYFDRRDSLKRNQIRMKFYFCSQFRSFNEP
jgi:hypothetical protein